MNFCKKFYDIVISLSIIGYDNYYRYIILRIVREEKKYFLSWNIKLVLRWISMENSLR